MTTKSLTPETRDALAILERAKREVAPDFPTPAYTWLESAIYHLHGYTHRQNLRASVLYPEGVR